MFKILCLFVGTVLLIEAAPADTELSDALRNGNWDAFQTLLRQFSQNYGVPGLVGNIENLKPDGNSHVYGHSVSAYKEWHNDNGKVSEDGKGVEVINNDGQVSRREFRP